MIPLALVLCIVDCGAYCLPGATSAEPAEPRAYLIWPVQSKSRFHPTPLLACQRGVLRQQEASMTILYEKIGRRYKPWATDEWRKLDMARPGHMLISVDGNCTSYLRGVDPDRAPVLAALKECRDAILNGMHKAAEFKPKVTKLSRAHQRAYATYQAAIPPSERQALWAGSIVDGVDAAIKVIEDRISGGNG